MEWLVGGVVDRRSGWYVEGLVGGVVGRWSGW